MTLKQILEDYYKTTGRSWPDFDHAMHFADTEKVEALEIYMAKFTQYIRNHPENKPKWDKDRFAEELGDFMMMIQVAGMVEGVDPLDALIKKLNRKSGKEYQLEVKPGRVIEDEDQLYLTSNEYDVGYSWRISNPFESQAKKKDFILNLPPKDRDIALKSGIDSATSEYLTNCYKEINKATIEALDKIGISPLGCIQGIFSHGLRQIRYQGTMKTDILWGNTLLVSYEFTPEGFKIWTHK